ncbi:MAG: hypothetical protein IPH26_03130 [Sterolibacteriaceae bacterium]|uniref:Uncharacterized protein n=1 Tax=Candidatus Methylophosphatis roskildensis TaxID=2899263 RepID=A0A9D7E0M9_9PROT|nr:hypothetical protein [Candidatus Methylophosphatis roskildensis]MBK7235016.1 hypothetical protein [Sterolibacteriaceae bacterium]
MATTRKARDEHDPYYDPAEPEAGVLPSLAEAVIIAVAAVIALFALYEIHESLDQVGQSITVSASTRGVDAQVMQMASAAHLDAPTATR